MASLQVSTGSAFATCVRWRPRWRSRPWVLPRERSTGLDARRRSRV